MPDHAEILRASTGELYRYRLAMHEQVPSIRAAIQAAQEERERISEAEYRLLFAPSMSHDAFVRQLHDTDNRDIEFV